MAQFRLAREDVSASLVSAMSDLFDPSALSAQSANSSLEFANAAFGDGHSGRYDLASIGAILMTVETSALPENLQGLQDQLRNPDLLGQENLSSSARRQLTNYQTEYENRSVADKVLRGLFP